MHDEPLPRIDSGQMANPKGAAANRSRVYFVLLLLAVAGMVLAVVSVQPVLVLLSSLVLLFSVVLSVVHLCVTVVRRVRFSLRSLMTLVLGAGFSGALLARPEACWQIFGAVGLLVTALALANGLLCLSEGRLGDDCPDGRR